MKSTIWASRQDGDEIIGVILAAGYEVALVEHQDLSPHERVNVARIYAILPIPAQPTVTEKVVLQELA